MQGRSKRSRAFRGPILALLLALSLPLVAGAQEKPNIVVIWGDDIGWYNISAFNLGVMDQLTGAASN